MAQAPQAQAYMYGGSAAPIIQHQYQQGYEQDQSASLQEQQRQLQARQQQQGLVDLLQRQANGSGGPSVAEQQMRMGLDAAAQQANALAAGSRGNPMLAMRQAQQAQGQLAMQAAGQGAALRAQEQLAARGQLGGLLDQMRGADMASRGYFGQQGQFQQGLQQSAFLANQQAQMQAALANQGAQLTEQQMAQQNKQFYDNLSFQRAMQNQQMTMGIVGGALGAAGSAMAVSDRRAKASIESGREGLRELLGKLTAQEWDYRDERHGHGRHIGVMAQDLERSRLGREMVIETPEGKMVDTKRMTAAALAAAAELNRRVERLEKRSA